MNNGKLLIVEDEAEIRELLKLYLEKNGFEVYTESEGNQAVAAFEKTKPDLILLDIQLPGVDGFEICRAIRKISHVPILFISCRNESTDIIRGLELGADDYIEKPFDPAIIVARVHANMRRAPVFRRIEPGPSGVSSEVLTIGSLEIDLHFYITRLNGKELTLTVKEMTLLAFLAKHPEQVFTTEQLYEHVWGADSAGDTRTVLVHISNLRKKLEAGSGGIPYIQNIRGVGYKFCP